MTQSTIIRKAAKLRNRAWGRLRAEIARRRRLRLALWDVRRRLGLGDDPAVGVARRAGRRLQVELALPQPPGRSTTRSTLDLTTSESLYVARCLAETGFGGYERESLACFLAMIDVAGPGEVLDIGANIGVYGLLAAGVSDRTVLAFEPTPVIAQAASDLADLNDLSMEVLRLALGDERTVATFYLSDKTDSSSSLAEGFRKSTHQIDVRVETIDHLVKSRGLRPAVLKIDTETTEPAILRGAMQTITEQRPWILCEILAGRTEEELTTVLEPFGYHWYHVSDDVPLTPTTTLAGDIGYKHLMWLFAPEPPPESFWVSLRTWTDALAALPKPDQRREPSAV